MPPSKRMQQIKKIPRVQASKKSLQAAAKQMAAQDIANAFPELITTTSDDSDGSSSERSSGSTHDESRFRTEPPSSPPTFFNDTSELATLAGCEALLGKSTPFPYDDDSDGDLDLITTGMIFQNDGSAAFTKVTTGLSFMTGAGAWGDYE